MKLLLLLPLSDLEAELMRPGNLESIARPQAGARGVGKGALKITQLNTTNNFLSAERKIVYATYGPAAERRRFTWIEISAANCQNL